MLKPSLKQRRKLKWREPIASDIGFANFFVMDCVPPFKPDNLLR
jgi:hypothetical protein